MAGKKTLLIVAGAIVIATGSVAAYLYFKGTPGKGTNALESAKIVPDKALMTTFISTDYQSWAKLQQFGTPEAQKVVAGSLLNLQSQMIADANIDFEKDLKPWVGGVTFAFMPSETKAASNQKNILMVVGIQNKLKALEFANKMKAQKQAKVEEKQYKGVTISNIQEQNGKNYNTAVLGDHLVMGFQKGAVEQAVDTFQGGPSYAAIPNVSAAIAKGTNVQNPIAQIYLNDYAAFMQEFVANSPGAQPLPAATLDQLKQVKSMVMGIGVDNDGLRLKAIASLDPQAMKFEFKPVSGKVVSQFPTETMALINGNGISQSWAQVVERSKETPELKTSVDGIRQSIKQAVNLDADKDVFGWMDGEFAFGLIASNQGILAQTGGLGPALVIETSDRATAEASLGKLEALIKQNSPFIKIEQREIQGKQITEWNIPPQGAILGHGWLDKNSLFVAMGPLVEVLATKPSNPLQNSPNFKAATNSLPRSNQGYFYLDMDRTVSVANTVLQVQGGQLPPDALAVLNSIRGIGMTATWPEKATSNLEMLFSLKPKGR